MVSSGGMHLLASAPSKVTFPIAFAAYYDRFSSAVGVIQCLKRNLTSKSEAVHSYGDVQGISLMDIIICTKGP
jgi:hypothetical protein